jgi:O-antigen ligase
MEPSSAGTSNRARRIPASEPPPGQRRADLVALAPAAGLAVVSLAAGTFPGTVRLLGVDLPGGASAAGAIVLHVLLLAAALFAAPGWRQPLALGRRGRFLPLALWVTVVAAAWASPVPRAGRVAVALLPAWLLLPAAVARCWPGRRERRRGLAAVAAVVALVALFALGDRFLAGSPRAAMPLGHHNLLAVWLVALLPVAALPLRRPGPARWLAAAGMAAGGAALFASQSLAGALGAVAVLAVAALRLGVRRRQEDDAGRRHPALAVAAALAALAALAVAAPRLAAVVAGGDPSLAVRATYARAGWSGFLARPLLGWGPGSTPWTVSEWMVPVPGLNPPGEVVGDLHSLPLQVLYELGVTGALFAAALALLFPWRRLIALPVAADRAVVVAGLLGLLGAGVALVAMAPLAVPAVWVALALAAGTALAGEAPERLPLRRRRSLADLPVAAYVAAAALVLLPIDRAHLAADRSLAAARPMGERAALAEAVRLDPAFPLYRARLARLAERDVYGAGGAAAAEALAAAEGAWGVGALWLAAGQAALDAGEPWAPIALERACRLDPLDAQAPYLLAIADPRSPQAPRRAARAFAAEPRLAAALAWRRYPELREDALDELSRWEGIEPGWRLAMLDAADAAWSAMHVSPTESAGAGVAHLALVLDRTPAGSLSLHAFRRRPGELRLVDVPLDLAAVRHLTLPPATVLPRTSAQAFGERGCRGSASAGDARTEAHSLHDQRAATFSDSPQFLWKILRRSPAHPSESPVTTGSHPVCTRSCAAGKLFVFSGLNFREK